MFADPQTVTIDSVAKTFVRQEESGGNSIWFCQDGATSEITMRIRHSTHKPNAVFASTFRRHNVEFVRTIYATETTKQKVRKQYITFERELGDVDSLDVSALVDFATAAGSLTKLHNSEP